MWILEILAEVILTFFDVPWSRRQLYAQVLCLTVLLLRALLLGISFLAEMAGLRYLFENFHRYPHEQRRSAQACCSLRCPTNRSHPTAVTLPRVVE